MGEEEGALNGERKRAERLVVDVTQYMYNCVMYIEAGILVHTKGQQFLVYHCVF